MSCYRISALVFLFSSLYSLSLASTWSTEPAPITVDIFTGGENGYKAYRIPAIIATKKGTLLAFCEGRKNDASDRGDHEVVLRRSEDNGTTWSGLQVVWNDANNTCGNVCPVVDEDTGTIWLFLTWNHELDLEENMIIGSSIDTRRIFEMHSDDDGKTWSKPIDLTSTLKDPDWRWYATGPGIGIQLKKGKYKGRLVIPCDHTIKHPVYLKAMAGAHVVYSDDHGKTWQLGDPVYPNQNENQVVELSDGTVLMNARNHHYIGTRAFCWSTDGGQTWPKVSLRTELWDPFCQGSTIRYDSNSIPGGSVILFSNPHHQKRQNMTVQLSYDDCKTWPIKKSIYFGPASYSCLVQMQDGRIGCLYECGKKKFHEKIVFTSFTLKWLTTDLGWGTVPDFDRR